MWGFHLRKTYLDSEHFSNNDNDHDINKTYCYKYGFIEKIWRFVKKVQKECLKKTGL